MTEIKALKYYTIARYRNPEGAANRMAKLREKNPDHEYTILVNMRAYTKQFIVSRVEHVEVQLPDIASLNLPPLPPKPAGTFGSNPQAWEDYRHEQRKREKALSAVMDPLMKVLSGPFSQ